MPWASALVLPWIRDGYALEFTPEGPPAPRWFPNHASARRDAPFVTGAVAELLASGAVVATTSAPRIVSPLGVATRADGKRRLILDLRYVNAHLVDRPFAYETLGDLASLASEGDLLFSCDLKSGYHHVDMHPGSWPFLGFEWEGQTYVFRSLPFGLKPACYVFTMVMKTLAEKWRRQGHRLLAYLDDFLFIVTGAAAFYAQRAAVLDDFESFGLLLGWEKCHLEPTTRLKHLGFLVDTAAGVFEIPVDRWERFRAAAAAALAAGRASARHISSLAGQIMSFSLAAGRYAYMYSRGLYALAEQRASWRSELPLTPMARSELELWLALPRDAFTRPIWRWASRPALTLCTDASDHGYGAVLVDDSTLVSDYLPAASPGTESSTWAELTAVHLAVESLASRLSGHEVTVYSDSQTTVRIINKGGSMKPHLHARALALLHRCIELQITLTAVWLPREANALADALSRRPHASEWCLHPRLFDCVSYYFGGLTVDLFASAATAQLPRFYSEYWCPGTRGLDAFRVDWSRSGRNWINAPFALLPRVLTKLYEDRAAAVVLVPIWPSRPWWPLLCPDGAHWDAAVRDYMYLPPAADIFVAPRQGLTGSTPPTSRHLVALLLDYGGRVTRWNQYRAVLFPS
jgi:ribonuclease HI